MGADGFGFFTLIWLTRNPKGRAHRHSPGPPPYTPLSRVYQVYQSLVPLIFFEVSGCTKAVPRVYQAVPEWIKSSLALIFHTRAQQALINTGALARCSVPAQAFSRFNGFPRSLTNC